MCLCGVGPLSILSVCDFSVTCLAAQWSIDRDFQKKEDSILNIYSTRCPAMSYSCLYNIDSIAPHNLGLQGYTLFSYLALLKT